MSARYLLFLFIFISFAYELITMKITIDYRKNPLPDEVKDVYDEKSYQNFINYSSDKSKLFVARQFIMLLFNALLIFSPFYFWMEKIGNGNVYLIALFTLLINSLFNYIQSYIFGYIHVFKIREKYGLNKMTKKKYTENFLLEDVSFDAMFLIVTMLIIYVFEKSGIFYRQLEMSFKTSLIYISVVVVGFLVIILVLSYFSLVTLKKKYKFTPLEDGPLKTRIMEMQSDSKKKVKSIYVYDESKNSNSKNAFLLKFLWHREFCIADNFILENSDRELYAVLSHEIGHLKHKKTIWNYLQYIFLLVFILVVIYFLNNLEFIKLLNQWINSSFNLSMINYALTFSFYSIVFQPIMSLFILYRNNIVRMEEYEADREAIKNGYGEEMIHMFKNVSKDELMDVNPSPIIEFLEHDHPSMYRRIKAISSSK